MPFNNIFNDKTKYDNFFTSHILTTKISGKYVSVN